MSTGQRAGLHTGASFKEEQQRVEERQRRELERSDPSLLGRNAMTVMRDKEGVWHVGERGSVLTALT